MQASRCTQLATLSSLQEAMRRISRRGVLSAVQVPGVAPSGAGAAGGGAAAAGGVSARRVTCGAVVACCHGSYLMVPWWSISSTMCKCLSALDCLGRHVLTIREVHVLQVMEIKAQTAARLAARAILQGMRLFMYMRRNSLSATGSGNQNGSVRSGASLVRSARVCTRRLSMPLRKPVAGTPWTYARSLRNMQSHNPRLPAPACLQRRLFLPACSAAALPPHGSCPRSTLLVIHACHIVPNRQAGQPSSRVHVLEQVLHTLTDPAVPPQPVVNT